MPPLGKLNDDTFKVSYRYEGLMREATVEEVRLSSMTFYRLRGKNRWWDIDKKNGTWHNDKMHPLPDEVFKQICKGIEAWIRERGF